MSASQKNVCLDNLEATHVKHLVKDNRFRIDLCWTQRDGTGSGLNPATTVGSLQLFATWKAHCELALESLVVPGAEPVYGKDAFDFGFITIKNIPLGKDFV